MIVVCQSLRSGPILVLELSTPVPRFFGTTSHCLSVQPFQLLPSRNIWRHISLTCPPPLDTVAPRGLLVLRNCFFNFAVEHWFGFAGNIGTIKVWLIDWFCGVSFDTEKLNRKRREEFAPQSFVSDKEEFSFVWVLFRFIHGHPWLNGGQTWLQTIQCCSRVPSYSCSRKLVFLWSTVVL